MTWAAPSGKPGYDDSGRDLCDYRSNWPGLIMLVGWVVILVEVSGWKVLGWMFTWAMFCAFLTHVLMQRHIRRAHGGRPVLRSSHR